MVEQKELYYIVLLDGSIWALYSRAWMEQWDTASISFGCVDQTKCFM